MKKTIFSILFFIVVTVCVKANDNLGFVARIIEMKNTSEFYLVSILHDSKYDDNQKKIALKNYNEIRLGIDMIVYQLSADMKKSGSINLYKKLDKYYKHFD